MLVVTSRPRTSSLQCHSTWDRGNTFIPVPEVRPPEEWGCDWQSWQRKWDNTAQWTFCCARGTELYRGAKSIELCMRCMVHWTLLKCLGHSRAEVPPNLALDHSGQIVFIFAILLCHSPTPTQSWGIIIFFAFNFGNCALIFFLFSKLIALIFSKFLQLLPQ